MLVSCDDFGILFFRSLKQYREFHRNLTTLERRKFHRHSTRHIQLRSVRTCVQTTCPMLLRVD